MLYLIYAANNPELEYLGGQGPIVHLEADVEAVVAWAKRVGRRWAFSLSNAGAFYTEFRNDLACLNEINWEAVAASDFRSPEIKEGKQAEFLVRDSLPWNLITRLGVSSRSVAQKAHDALVGAGHRPIIEIQRGWYF